MATLQGGCLCGAIHYHSDATPSKMIASDCRHCQKQAGAAIAISVGVRSDSLQVEGLRPSVYEDMRDSGSVILRSFCPTCGTPLFSKFEDDPELLFIKTASLDDPSSIESPAGSITSAKKYRHLPRVPQEASIVAEFSVRRSRTTIS